MGDRPELTLTELTRILYLYSVFREHDYLIAMKFKEDDAYSTADSLEEEDEAKLQSQKIGASLGGFIAPFQFINSITATLTRDESKVFAASIFVGSAKKVLVEDNSPFILCIAKDGPIPPSQEVTQYLQETWNKLQSIAKVDLSTERATMSARYAVFQNSKQYRSLWEDLYRHVFAWCYPKSHYIIQQYCTLAKRFTIAMRSCLRRAPAEGEKGKTTPGLNQRNALQKVIDLIDDVVHIAEDYAPGTLELDRTSGEKLFSALADSDVTWRGVRKASLKQWQLAYQKEIRWEYGGSYWLDFPPFFGLALSFTLMADHE
ncbi:hypothetical protein NLI96_g7364 [Meripilus lineatus]|uniref:Uncharacterized protein n=1 Tax=Meripilus lineatus TaxID=2056292 RepID=A0AAD5V128_9APHY|nr:hypothetical protein NLI96_g7364 [Physisporinus lineatus]